MLERLRDYIPRLASEEALVAASWTAVGSGTLKAEESRRLMDAWRRQAAPARHTRQVRRMDVMLDADKLQRFGVRVKWARGAPPAPPGGMLADDAGSKSQETG